MGAPLRVSRPTCAEPALSVAQSGACVGPRDRSPEPGPGGATVDRPHGWEGREAPPLVAKPLAVLTWEGLENVRANGPVGGRCPMLASTIPGHSPRGQEPSLRLA